MSLDALKPALNMQELMKLLIPSLQLNKHDPVGAVAILTGFAVKYRGGNRVNQDEAALIAVRLLKEGMPADIAIESAVQSVLQPP